MTTHISRIAVLGAALLALAAACSATSTTGASRPVDAEATAAGRSGGDSNRPGRLDPAAQAYVDAVGAEDASAIAASFAADGEIVDVGRHISGRKAIRRWAENEVVGGRLSVLEDRPRAGGTTLLVRFVPPGASSGFDATYSLDIVDGQIATATLEYA